MPPKRRNNKTKGENAKATAKPKSPEENHDQSTNDESDAEAQETPKGAKNGPKAKKLDYESRPTLPLSEHSETASDEESSDEKENESPEKPSKKPTNVAAKKNDSTANKQPPIKKQTKTVSPREKDMPSLFDTEESGSEETDEPEAAPSNAKSNLEKAVAAKKATKPTDKKVTITEQEADSDEEEEEQQTISPLKKVNRNMKKAEAPPKKTAKASPKKTAKASNAKKGAIANEEDKEEKKVAEKTANKEKEMNPKGATFKTRANAKKPPPSSNFAIESTTKHAPPDTSQADSSGPVFNSTATIAEKTKLVTCFLIGGVKKSSLQAVKNFLQKSNVNVVVNATKIRETLRKMFEDREIIPADGKEFTNISKTFKKGPVKVKTTDKPKKMTAKKTTRNNAKGMDKKKKMKANDGSDLEQYSDDEDVPPNKR